ncbi:hypothetical protein VZT92_014209 [Zoarces viviparus]|uniref:Uncharacterized protein n=1 Tax=Zoarces viviparus TaxID=48416 RepID=A0AAW1EZY0_ZOAVI
MAECDHTFSRCVKVPRRHGEMLVEIFVMRLVRRHPPFSRHAGRQPGQLLQGSAESGGVEGCWQVKTSPLTVPPSQSSPHGHCEQQAASK